MIKYIRRLLNDASKPSFPSRLAPVRFGYTPTSWKKEKDSHTGLWIYEDPRLNTVQDNLVTLNQLLADLRVNAKIDILEIQRNLEASTIKDPTVQRVGWVMAKMVECIALAFPAGRPAAVIAGLICRLASGGIQLVTSENINNPDYQEAVNDLRNAVDQYFSDLEDLVSSWIQDLQGNWTKDYPDKSGNHMRLCDLAEHDDRLPQKNIDVDYNHWFNALEADVKVEMTKQLLPVKYRRRTVGHSSNQDETEYSAYWFWNATWYEVRNSDTWDSWRRSPIWPQVPGNLRGDIEGPHEDIGNWEDIKGGHQYYQSINNDGAVVLNAVRWDNGQYWWTRTPGNRWMSWGGRSCPSNDAKEQGNYCDARTVGQDVTQGTPFLDFVDDVVLNRGFSWCRDHGDSTLLYYELKDPRTGEVVRNSRRQSHVTNSLSCKDYFYQINWFKWNWCYVGVQLRFYILVDDQGNRINDATARWLFRDDGHGRTTNPKGIANRLDVYFDWGLADG